MTEHRIDLETVKASLGGHSIFAPSGATMWANCPGSLIPSLFARDEAGEAAAEGTVAHAVADEWLETEERPDHLIGQIRVVKEQTQDFEIEITRVMLNYLEEYVDWVMYEPGEHFIETRVDFSDLTPIPGQTGTADHAICQPGKLIVTDLKYGKGVQVFAEKNLQIILYGYGFFRKYDPIYHFEEITLRIAQPRLNHFDEWTITRKELLEWAKWISDRAHEAWVAEDTCRVPGEKQCWFCPLISSCSALAVFVEHLLRGDESIIGEQISQQEMEKYMEEDAEITLEHRDPGRISLQAASQIYTYRGLVERYFLKLEDRLTSLLLAGEKVPGRKLVEGRVNRRLREEKQVVEDLDFYGVPAQNLYRPRQLKTLGDIEDELRSLGLRRKTIGAIMADITVKPKGPPTMVPESDPRPELVDDSEDIMGDIDLDDDEL